MTIQNLPPQSRYNTKNIFLLACYPGPSAPQNFAAFMKPLESELIQLFHGIPIVNCIDPNHKILKAYVCKRT